MKRIGLADHVIVVLALLHDGTALHLPAITRGKRRLLAPADSADMLRYMNDVLHPQGFENIVKDDFAALRQMLQQRR